LAIHIFYQTNNVCTIDSSSGIEDNLKALKPDGHAFGHSVERVISVRPVFALQDRILWDEKLTVSRCVRIDDISQDQFDAITSARSDEDLEPRYQSKSTGRDYVAKKAQFFEVWLAIGWHHCTMERAAWPARQIGRCFLTAVTDRRIFGVSS